MLTLSSSTALPIVAQNASDPLSQYAQQLLALRKHESPVDDVLHEMEAIAEVEQIPIIGRLEGAVIQMLLTLRGQTVKHVLDIGTAIGYSAIWMARALPAGAHITSIEYNQARVARARQFIQKSGLQDRITIVEGDVLQILPQMKQQFDFILQDVMKHLYFGKDATLAVQLLQYCLDHLQEGGTLLSDNAFCMGEVLHTAENLPNQVVGIITYNETIAKHPDLESVILPLRDGLTISHKRTRR